VPGQPTTPLSTSSGITDETEVLGALAGRTLADSLDELRAIDRADGAPASERPRPAPRHYAESEHVRSDRNRSAALSSEAAGLARDSARRRGDRTVWPSAWRSGTSPSWAITAVSTVSGRRQRP